MARRAAAWAAALMLFAMPAAAGELIIGLTQFPSTLNPQLDSMLAKSYVLAMTQRPITAYDQDWKVVCLLCTELPTLENGLAKRVTLPDGREGIAVTYTLRRDATWGDGTPVTSADMVFTWEVGRHPKSGVSNFEAFRRILRIDVVDDKTFTVVVDRVTFDYNALALDLLPAHIERPIFEADPANYRHRTAYDSDPTNPGLAFGPYRIVEVVSGARIVLARNETWWGAKPAFDRITVRVIENTAALEANLLSGAIDMIAGELGLTIDQALAFERRHGKRFRILYKPGLIYEHLDLNLDNPILADRRVRRALIHAIDRKAISERLFAGRQPVAHGPVSPLDWVYDPDLPKYDYDPDRAAALLDEAGWSLVKQGIRHDAAGRRLTLELMTTAGNRNRELVEQVLQSQWRKAGIDVRIRNQPARVFFGETVTRRKFTGAAMFAWLSSPENVPRTTLYSDQIPSAQNNWAGQNYTGFRNAEMDALIDAIEVELDRTKRKALWQRLQRLYAEELPAIPLFWRAEVYVLPKWLSGVRPTGHQYTTTLWVEEWQDAR
ncbi:MAG: peptide ABC transporter substrate-binding protein [Alphaproteobacteria bacterium]|nr:MAG: peptide ABC transporter substrate-binding protein [Alphaproteobacteria bacterium]